MTPIVKWAGAKRRLADQILALRPPDMQRYVEPFCGGAAVFFALRASGWTGPAVLNDVNKELIRTYRAVQADPEAVIRELLAFPDDKSFFLHMRDIDPHSLNDVECAAWMLFLNRTCFNGLWRVTKSGKFSAPFGKSGKRGPRNICQADDIRAASIALRNTELLCGSFRYVGVFPGDFVYCDPPYFPVSKTANFKEYSKGGFGLDEQRGLASCADTWRFDGATVVLSNADVKAARQLYGRFELKRVRMARAINSKASKRGKVGELLIVARPGSPSKHDVPVPEKEAA